MLIASAREALDVKNLRSTLLKMIVVCSSVNIIVKTKKKIPKKRQIVVFNKNKLTNNPYLRL